MKREIRKSIRKVYGALWDILALYEKTDGYNEIPQESEEKDIWEYMGNQLLQARRLVHMLFLGQEQLRDQLLKIVDETETFVRKYERPSVVKRWLQINPKLLYFDCSFQLMEEAPKCYKQISRGLANAELSCYPDTELIADRKKYFEEIQKKCEAGNLQYSGDRIFQDELLHTLTMVFENDFKEYL